MRRFSMRLARCDRKCIRIMRGRSGVLFREKQAFVLGYGLIALAMPPVGLLIVTCRQVFWNRPWGSPAMTNGGLLSLTIFVLLVCIRLATVRLVTELRPESLTVAMKGFFRRTRIAVADIRGAEVVEYDPLAEYGGYGIRSGPRGEAYIARGRQGVQLKLRDGREILVGSQSAHDLARRIIEAQTKAA